MFTDRESDILKLIFNGKSNKEIADSLNISVHTVKAHIEKIFYKHKVHSRIELIVKLLKSNIVLNNKH